MVWNIFDHYTAVATVFDFLFSDTGEHNALGRCRYSTYYCWDSVPDTIAASVIQMNCLVADTEPDDWTKRNHA